jgi:hypothetical protein
MIDDPAALAGVRADRSDRFFLHLAERGSTRSLIDYCLPGRRLERQISDVRNHDDRAALVCALTALVVAKGEFVAVGDDVDGWMILPPRHFIQTLYWDLLMKNASEEAPDALRVHEE